ncbi:GNAT family N-acetyltransferase [Dokdonia sp. Hel_I_53]|uniref:GNAT family N-acetyltransferase n=1 Tax=Dokdonia sp. Hel_I_53 TaxID=1566287 RepID=UPI0021BDAF19|nr:GNAT family N-acetyltransferase [Dokdonia sp. Hel_I_53]
MEYHSDRFDDHSLVVKKKGSIIAVMPANIMDNTLYSHRGLTYGGLLLSRKQKLKDVLEIFLQVLNYLSEIQISTLKVKLVPSFYAQEASSELQYLMQLVNAECVKVETASVIDYRNTFSIQTNRIEGVKKADSNGLLLIEENNFGEFWSKILIPNLKQRFQAKPTHSLEEIQRLSERFPKHIRQFNVYHDNKLVGGATIFETKTTAHVQYISGNDDKQKLGTLDYLFHNLITEIFAHKWYFDFGTSNENNGKQINAGLTYWKESFGARTMLQYQYAVQTKNHSLLNNVLV